jgi:hypothetical protein
MRYAIPSLGQIYKGIEWWITHGSRTHSGESHDNNSKKHSPEMLKVQLSVKKESQGYFQASRFKVQIHNHNMFTGISSIFSNHKLVLNQNRPPLRIFTYTLDPASQNIPWINCNISFSHYSEVSLFLSDWSVSFSHASANELQWSVFHTLPFFSIPIDPYSSFVDLCTSWPSPHSSCLSI